MSGMNAVARMQYNVTHAPGAHARRGVACARRSTRGRVRVELAARPSSARTVPTESGSVASRAALTHTAACTSSPGA